MQRGKIRFGNVSAKLIPGKVWAVDLSYLDVEDVTYAKTTSRTGIPFCRKVRDCPVDKRHITGREYLNIAIDLYGSERLGDFVPCSGEYLAIISEKFADKLRRSQLTGYNVRPIVKVIGNPREIEATNLFYLEFAGKGGNSKHLVVEGNANLCPHCRETPMVCPACGHTNWPKCVHCDQWTLFLPAMPECSHPNGFLIEGYPPDVDIVDAKAWDGSDFFKASGGLPFVSNKAKEWMEQTHTFPVEFEAALLNTEGVEDRLRDK
jgi:hypothetical protein